MRFVCMTKRLYCAQLKLVSCDHGPAVETSLSCTYCWGPTCCGKSQFVKGLLESDEDIIDGAPENIIWYGVYGEENSEEATREVETIPTSAVEQEVMRSVPKLYKAGARQLLDKIKEHRDVLNWNEKGELMYENKPITGSHVVDLVNDMLRHRKGSEPVGWSVFARGLARMNVSENLVRNPQRQSAIQEFKTRVRDETTDSPSRWLPTPPSTSSPVNKQRRREPSPRPQAVRWLRL